MEENKVLICNNCKEKILINSDNKISKCPYCGSSDISLKDNKHDGKRYFLGVRLDTSNLKEKLIWVLIYMAIAAVFALLFTFLAK